MCACFVLGLESNWLHIIFASPNGDLEFQSLMSCSRNPYKCKKMKVKVQLVCARTEAFSDRLVVDYLKVNFTESHITDTWSD